MGFISEMKSLAENENRRVKQTALIKRTHVAIFRDKHLPNKSIRDYFTFCCLVSNFLKNNMFSIEMDLSM